MTLLPVRPFRYPALLPLALLLCAVTALACGDSEDPDLSSDDVVLRTFESGDMELVVEIPVDGLGGDLTPEDITITQLEPDPGSIEGGELIASYRLEPEGAVFETPVRVAITVPMADAEVRLLLSSDDGEQSELLDPRGTLYDFDAETVALAFEIPHFSEADVIFVSGVSERARVTILDRPRAEYLVGESFDVRVRVNSGHSTWSEINSRDDGWMRRVRHSTLRDEPWTGDVHWFTSAPDNGQFLDALMEMSLWSDYEAPLLNEPPLSPERSKTPLSAPDTRTAAFSTQTFTCVKPGAWTISLSASAVTRAEVTITETGFELPNVSQREQKLTPAWPRRADGSFERLGGRCVQPATGTPEPTSTSVTDPSPTASSEPTAAATTEANSSPTAAPTPPMVSTPPPGSDATTADLGDEAPEGKVLVFLLDGVFFDPAGLATIDAHLPFCSYRHVHGGTIRSLVPQNGTTVERSEHLGECGFGPPNFYMIPDPR